MAIVATLTPSPVPANTLNGDVTGTAINHVTVAPAGGAGTYRFAHNLQWTPTFFMGVAELAEGTSPSATNALISYCIADTNSTYLAFNVGGNGTYDIYYI